MLAASMISPGGCLKKNDLKVAFRFDGSSLIGTGHFMRCLTLAAALRKRGAKTRFVCRYLPRYLRDLSGEKGVEITLLDGEGSKPVWDRLDHSCWQESAMIKDAKATIDALADESWDWLVVDHYAFDSRWETRLRQIARKIMVIDDIADRPHQCDLLLDQNLYEDMGQRYNGKVPTSCRLLLGPHYALLRNEFLELHKDQKPRSGPVKRIIVFLGGVDSTNFTTCVIEALVSLDLGEPDVDIIIGAQHPYRDLIVKVCDNHGFTCHIQTNRMAELFAEADLAIGAGGSASWERCCMGLPSLLVSLADNQVAIAKALDKYGACVYLGSAENIDKTSLCNAVMSIVHSPNELRTLSEKALTLVDGRGVERICKIITSDYGHLHSQY